MLRRVPGGDVRHRKGGRIARAVALACLLAAAAAQAESGVRLPWPDALGVVAAGTYDLDGRRLGDAHLGFEMLDRETVRLLVETGIDGGERNLSQALLRPSADGKGLELLVQTSESFTSDGRSLGELRVDHLKREASCSPPAQGGEALPDVAAAPDRRTDERGVQRLELPARDQVVNVPLNLLFQPLVRGEKSRIDFQIFLCRGGARLWDFSAEVERRERSGSRALVEVRYRPNLGMVMTALAAPLLPELAFWFDGDGSAAYLGHRFSLYTKGPEVVVAREGASQGVLLLSH